MEAQQFEGLLSASNAAAIAAVRVRAVGEGARSRRRIEDVVAGQGARVDVRSLCSSVLAQARVTLNFHPDRLVAGGRTVAEALRDEAVYRSQFETGISNGGLTAYPGGDRDEWEQRLFEGAYHSPGTPGPIAARPKNTAP